MAQTLEDIFKEVYGTDTLPNLEPGMESSSDQVDPRIQTPSGAQHLFDFMEGKEEPVATESAYEGNAEPGKKLKQADLLKPQNLNTIREYMIAKHGVDYDEAEAETVVDDFVENMRWFNTNTISTAGEVVFMTRANDRQKQVAGEAYKLYDSLDGFWANDGLYGAAEGIFDYVSAAAADPSNYIGLLTGGLAKAGTITIAQGGKLAIKKAAAEAAKRATESGATKLAVQKAATEAAEATAKKLEKMTISNAAAKKAKEVAVDNAKKLALAKQQQAAAKMVTAQAAKKANRNALIATAVTDGAIAYFQDDAIQDIYIEANYQDKYNRMQSLMTTAMGGLVGPAAQYTFGKLKGASGFQSGSDALDLAQRTGPMEDFLPMLEKKNQDKAKAAVRSAYDSWNKKVARGEAKLSDQIMPETVFAEIINGVDGKGGLTQIAIDSGIKIRKKGKTVSDILTNMVKFMPEEDFIEISKMIEESTMVPLGDYITNPMELGDVLAKSINGLGSSMAVLSHSRKRINKATVAGNDILNAAVSEIDAKQMQEITMQRGGYAQNVWKRLLVSSPATTALNLAGFGSFALGQSASDLLSFGMVGTKAVLTGNAELYRQAKVYKRIQGQKMKNFADPLTTYDTYMKLLDAKPDVQKVLFETVGAGVERTADRFGINPESKLVFGKYGLEKIVGAANDLTGVRIQDSFTKSQMFMSELDKYVELKHKKTLAQILEDGSLDLIDEEVTGLALDTTMKSVFAKDYTTKNQARGVRDIAKLVETFSAIPGVGTILPFGRFMNNVVASAYQWSPLAYAGPASNILRKQKSLGGTMQAREAFSRATVGTSALLYATQIAESQEEQGLGTYQLRHGSTIIDVENVYPLSYILAAGKVGSYMAKGEPVTREMSEDLLKQLAVGQFAKDVQFGTDLGAIIDYFSPIGGTDTGGERSNMFRELYNSFTDPGKEYVEGDEPGVFKRAYEMGEGVAEAVGKPVGNVVAGVFRPLDPINKLTGFMFDLDTVKDPRQARGYGKFSQSATRYFDNILEAIGGETENITGESLRVASREGELYDPNPLARIFGLKVVPGRSSTEKMYSLSGIKSWTKDQRSNVPAYDRIFNETMAPMLERRMGLLLNNSDFKKLDLTDKRSRVNKEVQSIRSMVRDTISTTATGEDFLQVLRKKAMGNGSSEQRSKAMREMREEGFKANLKDFNWDELRLFDAKIELQKIMAKPSTPIQ
tara:strand:+ start:2376 stop:6032 length:3657 start_codon:yes stop_codon:yes gene_type:complete